MKSRFFFLLLLVVAGARAEVKPAALFGDHAVLQRDQPVPVWGTADAGEKVLVTFAQHTVETVADGKGQWRVELPSMAASFEPRSLVIQGTNTVTFSDILVGEVWLASGQSNMQRVMRLTFDAAIEYAAAKDFSMIREFKVRRVVADTSADEAAGSWFVAGPETLPELSAVGYYFARDLYAMLGVPVGIINSTWGGTPGEAWINADALAASAVNDVVHQRWRDVLAAYPEAKAKHEAAVAEWKRKKAAGEPVAKAPAAPQGPGHHYTPSGLFNGMIAPLAPMAFRGVIWYQGENNARVPRDREYRELFPALITGWRQVFNRGDFPFYWVQLSNFGGGKPQETGWATLRESQTLTLALPHTGQAVTLDIGDVSDIHPKEKRQVGRRLARVALRGTYGYDIVDRGPVFSHATREGDGYRVHFTHADGGLVAPLVALTGFELAGEDRIFYPASAQIDGATVVVASPAVPAPVAVRYAWRNAVTAGLFNGEGLPAWPFRTDSWD
jgi:sialate O-acetylesterase